jgi:hypothetical protein
VNGYDRDLDSVAKHDVPIAVEIMTKAKFVTLVVDEDPPGGLPAQAPGAAETLEQVLQRTPHHARIGIWDLATKTRLLRLRAEAAAEFVALGSHAPLSAEAVAAQARQANSCSLALAVREKIASLVPPAQAPAAP